MSSPTKIRCSNMNLNKEHACGVTIIQVPSGNLSAGRQHEDGIALTKIL